MGQVVNILHISDLHYTLGGQRYNQSVVLDALRQDLEIVCAEGLSPDVIVITGDIAHAGDDESIYYEFYEKVLGPILLISRCSESRVFLSPGNHDAHRKVVLAQVDEQRRLRDRFGGRDELNDAYLKGELTDFIRPRFAEFKELNDLLSDGFSTWDDPLLQCSFLDGIPLDIISLNTAWFTEVGIGQSDYGRLLFPEAALRKAREKCQPGHVTLYLSHHPLSWLSEYSAADATDMLGKNGGSTALHLFGHAHDPRPQLVISPQGNFISSQSGALYSGRKRYNGYSIVTLELSDPHPVISLRSYFDKSRQFDKAVDVCAGGDGKFFPSEKSKRFWHRYSRRVDRSVLSQWLAGPYGEVANRDYNEGIVSKPVGDVFVAPPLYLKSEIECDENGLPNRIEAPIELNAVVTARSNYVFYGREDYGKTTLLRQIALRLIRVGSSDPAQIQIPIMIAFEDIHPGQQPVQRALRGALLADFPEGINLSMLLDEGLVTVLVDDVFFTDRQRIKFLKDFMTQFPRNRFLISAVEAQNVVIPILLGEDLVVDPGAPVNFEHIFMKPFTRHKMRSLVEKWDPNHLGEAETILNRLTRELAGMQIPVTAVNGSILLTIYEDSTGATPINRANLIDRFIEHVLEKRSLREAFRGAFDYKNKVHVLAAIAKYMALNDSYVLPEANLVGAIRAYLNNVGLDENAESLIHLFVQAKILVKRSEGCLSFRYRAFLEYFIAYQMQVDSTFKSWVLDEERYLRFCNELQYYAGLQRQDSALLQTMGERFQNLSDTLSREVEWDPDLHRLDSFVPPDSGSKTDIFDDIKRQLETPPLDEKERDDVLEGELPHDAEDRQEVFRPSYTHTGQKWTAALLAYSGIVKNLDLIDDTLKRRHLALVMKGWGFFTLQVLFAVPLVARHRRIKINGVNYEVLVPHHFSENEVARLLYLECPLSISQLVMAFAGTEKLSRQLREPSLDESDEPLIVQFYRNTLIADLKLPGWPESLARFSHSLRDSRYLCEAVLRKMSYLYLLGGHGTGTERKLKELIGDTVASLRGRSRDGGREAKSKAIQALDRKALLNRLRISASESAETPTDKTGKDS